MDGPSKEEGDQAVKSLDPKHLEEIPLLLGTIQATRKRIITGCLEAHRTQNDYQDRIKGARKAGKELLYLECLERHLTLQTQAEEPETKDESHFPQSWEDSLRHTLLTSNFHDERKWRDLLVFYILRAEMGKFQFWWSKFLRQAWESFPGRYSSLYLKLVFVPVLRCLDYCGDLDTMRKVYDCIPSEVWTRSLDAAPELASLRWVYRHQVASFQTGVGAVFPQTVDPEKMWDGPHLAPKDLEILEWMPGRVQDKDTIVAGVKDAGGEERYFRVAGKENLKRSGLSSIQEHVGQFFEAVLYQGAPAPQVFWWPREANLWVPAFYPKDLPRLDPPTLL